MIMVECWHVWFIVITETILPSYSVSFEFCDLWNSDTQSSQHPVRRSPVSMIHLSSRSAALTSDPCKRFTLESVSWSSP
ncbi:hypothetical protein M758_4G047200 [Ceratodon purpureus]|nr:hypothetical protein M758_4G047200 [Ceratodon purpureus]